MKTPFSEWLRRKEEHGWSLAQAAENTFCGEGCGMCRPYLRVVAATGQTELPLMTTEELAAYAEEGDEGPPLRVLPP